MSRHRKPPKPPKRRAILGGLAMYALALWIIHFPATPGQLMEKKPACQWCWQRTAPLTAPLNVPPPPAYPGQYPRHHAAGRP